MSMSNQAGAILNTSFPGTVSATYTPAVGSSRAIFIHIIDEMDLETPGPGVFNSLHVLVAVGDDADDTVGIFGPTPGKDTLAFTRNEHEATTTTFTISQRVGTVAGLHTLRLEE